MGTIILHYLMVLSQGTLIGLSQGTNVWDFHMALSQGIIKRQYNNYGIIIGHYHTVLSYGTLIRYYHRALSQYAGTIIVQHHMALSEGTVILHYHMALTQGTIIRHLSQDTIIGYYHRVLLYGTTIGYYHRVLSQDLSYGTIIGYYSDVHLSRMVRGKFQSANATYEFRPLPMHRLLRKKRETCYQHALQLLRRSTDLPRSRKEHVFFYLLFYPLPAIKDTLWLTYPTCFLFIGQSGQWYSHVRLVCVRHAVTSFTVTVTVHRIFTCLKHT